MEIEKNTPTPAVSKRLFRLLQSVYFALCRILSKQKVLIMDLSLHFLLERGKVAGRTIGRQLTYRCRDHDMSFYSPRDAVEFSCSNTPTRRRNNRQRHGYQSVRAVERAFAILDSEGGFGTRTPSPSPSPAAAWSYKSPAAGQRVDKEAEDFIRRFYEQLRSQQRMNVPESGFGR